MANLILLPISIDIFFENLDSKKDLFRTCGLGYYEIILALPLELETI